METDISICEIEKVIDEINNEINMIINDDNFMDEFPIEVECISNGKSKAIMFLGFRLWSSEDDERSFVLNSKSETREPVKDYLMKEILKIVKQVALIGQLRTNE